ncbi:hypothetical protein EV361DRAFT_886824 [Lentinula raphanica]|uniref:F-box domain-containing protein n=1 Tax=Lentinula raphanica TaxID=153919 RepID=A0AA38U9T1_9AGAR|nr:hypothetical protein F5878DRAFT_628852 [Lentinula raphanica]KAJ3975850.1 hypothetical protein EV361DRAFT_886824 [Lentinula raphanica]
MSSSSPSTIAHKIPNEIWERVAYHANATEQSFLGPPKDIVNICLVCQSFNRAIGFDANPSLYARIFRFKFDYRAPLRRFGTEWLNARSMAHELKKRFEALKQIRQRECSTQDLWTCYLMMLENDGRNERQLIEWAHLYGYLKHETCLRYEAEVHSHTNWYKGTEATSLLLWLWWMTFSRDDVRIETPRVRDSLVYPLLHNLILASFRYPSFYGPESHFHIASAEDARNTWSSTPPTPVARVKHFGKDFDLATPLLNMASFLVWTVRLETIREANPIDQGFIASLPLDRESATARRIQGPTRTDILNFHQSQIRAPIHSPTILCTSFEEEILTRYEGLFEEVSLLGSRRYDQDWRRIVAQPTFLPQAAPLSHDAHEAGALLGSWEGFFVQPSLEDHIALVDDSGRIPSEPLPLYRHPLYFTLQEHHCYHPDVPLASGSDCLGGQDVLNAWLPQGVTIVQYENEIEALDPVDRRNVRYHTFLPERLDGKRVQHSRDSYEDDSSRPTNSFSYPKGRRINDILITGHTSEEKGAAWGHYDFIGRVRLWDGLIVLLRTPRDPTRSDLGRWLFRGYLHDHNLVGHWRETGTSPNLPGYQGGFVAHRLDGQTPE